MEGVEPREIEATLTYTDTLDHFCESRVSNTVPDGLQAVMGRSVLMTLSELGTLVILLTCCNVEGERALSVIPVKIR